MPAVPASIKLTAFICPHCETYTTQYWSNVFIEHTSLQNDPPLYGNPELTKAFSAHVEELEESEEREAARRQLDWVRELEAGAPHIDTKSTNHYCPQLHNVAVSRCYECNKFTIWQQEKMIYPSVREGPPHNADMPAPIVADYEEARSVLNLSPRSSAALLRLVIEKLVQELKAQGDDLNKKIAWLVSQGLPIRIQQALDIVRVIGNEAIHPGTMDLRDDRDTAFELFDLVNLIVNDRITQPAKVDALYARQARNCFSKISDGTGLLNK